MMEHKRLLTVAACWAEVSADLEPDMCTVERETLRTAFYAGAAGALASMLHNGVEAETLAREVRAETLAREARAEMAAWERE